MYFIRNAKNKVADTKFELTKLNLLSYVHISTTMLYASFDQGEEGFPVQWSHKN